MFKDTYKVHRLQCNPMVIRYLELKSLMCLCLGLICSPSHLWLLDTTSGNYSHHSAFWPWNIHTDIIKQWNLELTWIELASSSQVKRTRRLRRSARLRLKWMWAKVPIFKVFQKIMTFLHIQHSTKTKVLTLLVEEW